MAPEIFMPFGKHRGTVLSKIPADYLQWLLREADLQFWLRQAVQAELEARATQQQGRRQTPPPPPPPPRGACPDPKLANELIGIGLRHLARKHHPDAGGTHEGMVAVNNVADWLIARARSGV